MDLNDDEPPVSTSTTLLPSPTLVLRGGVWADQGGRHSFRSSLLETAFRYPQREAVNVLIVTAALSPQNATRFGKGMLPPLFIRIGESLGIQITPRWLVLHEDCIEFANTPSKFQRRVENADIVFFSGGCVSQCLRCLNGTLALERILERYRASNLLICGNSCGLTIQSDSRYGTITGGVSLGGFHLPEPHFEQTDHDEEDDSPPALENPKSITYFPNAGLSTCPGFVFDSHFSMSAYHGRLMHFAHHVDAPWACGLDDNSVLTIIGGGTPCVEFVVQSSGGEGVWVFDMRNSRIRVVGDGVEQEGDQAPTQHSRKRLENVLLTLLTEGDRMIFQVTSPSEGVEEEELNPALYVPQVFFADSKDELQVERTQGHLDPPTMLPTAIWHPLSFSQLSQRLCQRVGCSHAQARVPSRSGTEQLVTMEVTDATEVWLDEDFNVGFHSLKVDIEYLQLIDNC